MGVWMEARLARQGSTDGLGDKDTKEGIYQELCTLHCSVDYRFQHWHDANTVYWTHLCSDYVHFSSLYRLAHHALVKMSL